MPLILALDQGTTSSRAIVFDERGVIHALAQEELSLSQPHPGWVEQNPREILETQRLTAEKALRGASGPVVAVGITNQRETTLLWERESGRAVYPAIVWQDRRTAKRCEELRQQFGEDILERTGLIVDPYFSATKLSWILENDPQLKKRARRGELLFGTVDTFLLWQLSSGALHLTDPSNASRTMLFNLKTLSWDEDLLRLFDIPPEVLPEVRPSIGTFGEVQIAGHTLPVCAVLGDQQAALFGQHCFSPGMAKNTYGTGCFLMLNLGAIPRISRSGLITTVAWQIGERATYALEGGVFVAGAAVQWLRDGLGIISDFSQVQSLAASVNDSDGVVFVPALTGLGAPHWIPEARGVIFGITRKTSAAHIARATLEGIAFQVADVVQAMHEEYPVQELRVDGGASGNDLLMQFQSDILGVPLRRPESVEATAFGAALAAQVGCGVWGALEEIQGSPAPVTHFYPKFSDGERVERLARWREAVCVTAGVAQGGGNSRGEFF